MVCRIVKKRGKVQALTDELFSLQGLDLDSEMDVHVGIAHTRWATHGVPNAVNSHPQRSDNSNGMGEGEGKGGRDMVAHCSSLSPFRICVCPQWHHHQLQGHQDVSGEQIWWALDSILILCVYVYA